MEYADVILDIRAQRLDRPFQYRIPEEMQPVLVPGTPVLVPFGRGNGLRKGYVVRLSDTPELAESAIKCIAAIPDKELGADDELVALAFWMKEQFGGTYYDALRTVVPVKTEIRKTPKRELAALVDATELKKRLEHARKKHYPAKVRLLEELLQQDTLPYELVADKLNCSMATIRSLEKDGTLVLRERIRQRKDGPGHTLQLNEEQQLVVDAILQADASKPFLLFGVTGSGKTEVYLRSLEKIVAEGRQAIVLIPEIALTYQTLMRFMQCFGDRVAYMHSRMSAGERYEISERARSGELSIMIGPRSALFTPFPRLGLIIVDEEHETSYKSENAPGYHAREVAVRRASLCGAKVILGSATPSLEAYNEAKNGSYQLLTLTKRAKESRLPKAHVVDMRKELQEKNRSVFSRLLKEKIQERLHKGEQTMLFLNRRGYAGFVSCRGCGEPMKCPHCDISLTLHHTNRLVCHYCGYQTAKPEQCPSCGSPYLAGFGSGTQKIEELVKREFPEARVLRMDADTTKDKDGHARVLQAFRDGEADVLIGTQMIVKGHDFSRVTLMGILAADMSMFEGDFRSAERTFDLLCQAAGRAGRAELPGEVVIQTYQPEHFVIQTAANQDYQAFYAQEIAYRQRMQYPPAGHLLAICGSCDLEEKLAKEMDCLLQWGKSCSEEGRLAVKWIGPAPGGLKKAKDLYRYTLFAKGRNYAELVAIKNHLERSLQQTEKAFRSQIRFDFNPLHRF